MLYMNSIILKGLEPHRRLFCLCLYFYILLRDIQDCCFSNMFREVNMQLLYWGNFINLKLLDMKHTVSLLG